MSRRLEVQSVPICTSRSSVAGAVVPPSRVHAEDGVAAWGSGVLVAVAGRDHSPNATELSIDGGRWVSLIIDERPSEHAPSAVLGVANDKGLRKPRRGPTDDMTTVIANGHANGHANGVALKEPALAADAKEAPVRVAEAAEAAEVETQGAAADATPNGTGTNTNTSTSTSTSTAEKSPLYPKSRLSLVDRFIDEPRSLRVAVIGGGLAGVLAGILFPAKVPNIQLTIYEKNHDFGGTWLENVYPGVRCDIPSHVYQATFEPKRDWSDQFSPGAEIRDYWQGVARKHDVYRFAKFRHRVEAADWDADRAVWRLVVRDLGADRETVDEVDVLFTAIGRFNAWKLPDYPGMSEYRGLLRHASNWDPSFDPRGKRVAVIGNGASGIQLVANLQKVVARLDHYARNRTWIAASWAGDERTLEAQPIPPEQQESFRDDRTYLAFRKELEDKYWRRFGSFFRGSDLNRELRDRFVDIMRRRLARKPELLAHMIPDFSPNCRRLTPGPGYLEALTEDNVDYIRTPIRRLTETGIETEDGRVREVDAIICATGANVDSVPPFPIRARGRDLRDLWRPDGAAAGEKEKEKGEEREEGKESESYGFPYTYLGLATPGFPNLFFVHGPHGTGPSGTVPHSVETQLTYYAKVLRKMGREGIRSLQPSRRAADDFLEYADAFFATTVLADGCSSWYNGGRPGGRIHGVWPGSAGHVTAVRREPRWEDWEYEYLSDTGNRFAWYFGNGWTKKEQDPASDMTSYLKLPSEIDLRNLHEPWWDLP